MAVRFLVQTGNGLLVEHTPEEFAALCKGVDRYAAFKHGSPLEVDDEQEDLDPSAPTF